MSYYTIFFTEPLKKELFPKKLQSFQIARIAPCYVAEARSPSSISQF